MVVVYTLSLLSSILFTVTSAACLHPPFQKLAPTSALNAHLQTLVRPLNICLPQGFPTHANVCKDLFIPHTLIDSLSSWMFLGEFSNLLSLLYPE